MSFLILCLLFLVTTIKYSEKVTTNVFMLWFGLKLAWPAFCFWHQDWHTFQSLIAERHLLAGLDPFPTWWEFPNAYRHTNNITIIFRTINDRRSFLKPISQNSRNMPTSTTYLSNYSSTTIKSLLWQIYDSRSICFSRVWMSIEVGESHNGFI